MKILVCGGRHFNNYFALSNILADIIKNNTEVSEPIEIVSGHCVGADQLGEKFAKQLNLGLKVFPAEWDKYGKAAGPIRNKQMIDYIKNDSNPFVLAFTSNNTKGTNYTLDLAKKLNINYEEVKYITEDLSLELLADINEGVGFENGKFHFDWSNDSYNDIIHFNKGFIHRTKAKNNVRYYGYKIEKSESNKDYRNQFLAYIKSNDGLADNNIIQMIDFCVEDFCTDLPEENFDYIIQAESKSNLVSILGSKLSENLNVPILKTIKKPPVELEFDYTKFWPEYSARDSEEGKEKFYNYMQGLLKYAQNKDYFSIGRSGIPVQYRKYLKPMFNFVDTSLDLSKASNILIIDDTYTTGSTCQMLVNLLEESNYNGNIVILTLIKN